MPSNTARANRLPGRAALWIFSHGPGWYCLRSTAAGSGYWVAPQQDRLSPGHPPSGGCEAVTGMFLWHHDPSTCEASQERGWPSPQLCRGGLSCVLTSGSPHSSAAAVRPSTPQAQLHSWSHTASTWRPVGRSQRGHLATGARPLLSSAHGAKQGARQGSVAWTEKAGTRVGSGRDLRTCGRNHGGNRAEARTTYRGRSAMAG